MALLALCLGGCASTTLRSGRAPGDSPCSFASGGTTAFLFGTVEASGPLRSRPHLPRGLGRSDRRARSVHHLKRGHRDLLPLFAEPGQPSSAEHQARGSRLPSKGSRSLPPRNGHREALVRSTGLRARGALTPSSRGGRGARRGAASPAPSSNPGDGTVELVREARARVPVLPAEPGRVTAQVHGELQLRASGSRDLRLRQADGRVDELGLPERYYYWLKVTPRVAFGADFDLVLQADVPRGSRWRRPSPPTSRSRGRTLRGGPHSRLRRALALRRYRSSSARLRVRAAAVSLRDGHRRGTTADHPPLFGDYYGGDRYRRAQDRLPAAGDALAAPLLAGDLVYRDRRGSAVGRRRRPPRFASACTTAESAPS